MCGFAVAIDWPEATATVEHLISGILHRGGVTDPVHSPAPNVAMCTRRLCIVDRENATQPQASFDGKLFVSFNGEIYNHQEIRQDLEALGVRFTTNSDTEVLVNALRIWGHRSLTRLSGMYAFVAFEPGTGQFLAARDPFGIKPLYIMQSGNGGFLFCSEMRPLLDTVESGDVLALPPGFVLTKNTCAKFPSLVNKPSEPWQPNDKKILDRHLAEAVRSHVPPDLPCAIMFSGGIDSTLVAHYARQVRSDIPGYFVGSPGSADYPFAMAYAEVSGFDLRRVPFDPTSDEVFASLGDAVAGAESFEPALVRGAVCSRKVSEQIQKDGFRVALCGEGADELFCGYTPLEQAFAQSADLGRAMREECLGLMNRISLQRVDRCSMQHALETRVPFLDPVIANYALQLEADDLVRNVGGRMVGKAALRDLFDLYPQHLPRMIRDRSKILFSEGTGLVANADDFAWDERFEAAISDQEFQDGRKEFAAFSLRTKEELYYLRLLRQSMDVFRVPQMRNRAAMTVQAAPLAAKTA